MAMMYMLVRIIRRDLRNIVVRTAPATTVTSWKLAVG